MLGSFEKRGDVGIIWIDNPPVNAISAGVRAAILDGCAKLAADPSLVAGVLACAGRTFMAGADITEFGKPPVPPSFEEVIGALEGSAKPIVAAIHGTALGGGFECALACHVRVAAPSAQVGLPEVKLGLLPGAGGTQRLPRLIGIAAALDVIVSGEPLPAAAAAEKGAIDRIVTGDLVDGAIEAAREAAGRPPRRVRDLTIDMSSLPADFFEAARQRLARERRDLFAPQRIVDALEAAARLPFDQGVARERELFIACSQNAQSRALQHIFFAERRAAVVPGVAKGTKARRVESAAVIGAGTMGGGIAMSFANAGVPVVLLEVDQASLDRGLGVVRRNYEASAAKGRLTAAQVEERMRLIRPTLSYDDLGQADLVIEAVFETMAVKKEVFARLDRVARPGAILASNTSYLSIDEIAEATARPADVVGTHFFSPANVMRLLEVVRGAATAPDVLATVLEVARRIKKVGVVAGNRDGFIGNRMLGAYAHQAGLLLLEGAAPERVDAALRAFGMPMGIFQMGDLAGLDVGYRSRRDRDPASYDTRATRVPDLLVEMGRLGQKSGAGYYDYAPGDRTPRPSQVVAELIGRVAGELGFARHDLSDQDIVERCFLPLVNVGFEVLHEGVASRASDIDIVYVNGYGFPAYRGGPMHWAEQAIGLPAVLEKVRAYSALVGEQWLTPSPLLEELVAGGRALASLDRTP